MTKRRFNSIYLKYNPKLKCFLKQGWGISNEDIEEIIHDVMLIIFQKCSNPFFIFNSGYIYKVAKNRAIDLIRNNSILTSCSENFNDYPSEDLTPEQQLLGLDQSNIKKTLISAQLSGFSTPYSAELKKLENINILDNKGLNNEN